MSAREYSQPVWVAVTIRLIGRSSLVLASVSLVALFLLMLAETIMRYFFQSPLGWNVSAVEQVLLPAGMFLALPWLYVCAGHANTEMLYAKLPERMKVVVRGLTLVIIVVTALILLYAGMAGVIDSYQLDLMPLTGSAELHIPTWSWQMIQPVGALGVLLVALLDAPRYLRQGEVEAR